MRRLSLFTLALASLLPAHVALAQMPTINASGKAPMVGKKPDPTKIMNAALDDAKRDVVIRLLTEAIGFDGARNVSVDRIEALKGEISPEAIRVVGTPAEVNGSYVVNVTANVDREWFRQTMDKYGIKSSSRRSGAKETIVMMVDLTYGVSRDLSQPKEVVTEFSSSKGASFSDTSVAASSEKYKEGSSQSSAQGSSARGSAAAGASGYYGSAAARSGYIGSQASRNKSASASSYSNSEIQKNNVQAEVHDDVNFRQQVTNQDSTSQQGAAEEAITAVKSTAENFGLEMLPINMFSSQFFGGRAPSWADLQNNARFRPLLAFLKSNNVKFFLGGTLNVIDGGRSGTGRFVNCSGSLVVNIMPTGSVQGLPGASAKGTASGLDAGECQNNLVDTLGKDAGEQIGNKVQDYWRKQSEDAAFAADGAAESQQQATQAAYARVEAGADYTVTFNAPGGLDYMVARQVGQMLPEIAGVDRVARISIGTTQVVYQVFYKAKTEFDVAIMDKFLPNSSFAEMRPQELNGSKLTLCISGCN